MPPAKKATTKKAAPVAAKKPKPASAKEPTVAETIAAFIELPGPAVGDPAPDFELESTEGGPIRLRDFAGKSSVVLYFYPKDDTPGCTKEACEFSRSLAALRKRGAAVLGVSTDSLKSHVKFASKFDLAFPLLSDPDGEVSRRYGAYKRRSMYGRTYLGIERSTFLIDKKGQVAAAWRAVKVDGHVAEVLAALEKAQ